MAESKIIIKCLSCNHLYELDNLKAGQLVKCPCGIEFNTGPEHIVAGQFTGDSPVELQKPQSQAKTSIHTPDSSAVDILKDPVHAVKQLADIKQKILNEISKTIVGQEDVIDQIITAFFARGHCLLLGVPGLAKTLMVHCLSQTMHLVFQRIQFTPDLMPTDITGTNILEEDPQTGKRKFMFHKGPVFCNILLADEINRTPPKTQAALLEAMQEHHVTSVGRSFPLPNPFCVLATQNPLEQEGTYPLPEAQLDRFLFLVKVDYPDFAQEQQILLSTTGEEPADLSPVIDIPSVINYQKLVRNVPVSEHVAGYAARLARATRPQDEESPEFVKKWVRYGCGPRAGQALILAAKAHAVLNGKYNISCDDIVKYSLPVMRHRIFLNFAAVGEGIDADQIINRVIDEVKQ